MYSHAMLTVYTRWMRKYLLY